jgi:hypothetical protein
MVHEQLIQELFLIVHLYVEYDLLNITFHLHLEYYDEKHRLIIVFVYHLNVQITIQQIFIKNKTMIREMV